MNQKQINDGNYIRSLTSEEAASYLVQKYSLDNLEYGEVFKVISQRSWKRADQIKLCKYYMQNIPHANEAAYEAFASFMSIKLLVRIIKETPFDASKKSLLLHYLLQALSKHAQTQNDMDEISSIIDYFENLE